MKHYLIMSLTLAAVQATSPLAWQPRYHHYYPQLNYGRQYLDPRSVSNDGEPSLRDLDIGVGIGVKDNDEDINPLSPEDLQQYAPVMAQEASPSSKEVNIGLYTDPNDNPQTYPRSPLANYFNPIQPQRNPYDSPFTSLPYPYSNGVQYPLAYPQRAFSYQQLAPQVQTLEGPAVQNIRSYENPFNLYERFRVGSYDQRRMRNPVKQLIVNEEGAPVMVAEPYGSRRVGAFKLLNDQGYHVTMNVPPSPTGVADGVLVMEMKATLYRPVK